MNDMPLLTEQQQRAVDTRGTSVVLSAVAGCGKTRVLTERYVSHLFKDRAAVGEIIAFTFTDKAAREMRKRIRVAVRSRTKNADSEDEEHWWRDQERDLETANIGTIHAFCTQLLQRFAIVGGLDPGLEILDETIAPGIRDTAVRETLYMLLETDGETGDALRELVRWYGWSHALRGIDDLIREPSATQWPEWIDKPTKDWLTALMDARQVQIDELNRPGSKVANLLTLLNATPMPGPKMAERVALILDEFPKLSSAKDPVAALARIRDACGVKGGEAKSKWPNGDEYERTKDALVELRGIIDKDIEPLFAELAGLERAADVGRMFLQVALECVQTYAMAKRSRGAIDFNDQLIMARDLLRDRKEVRATCQKQYKFLLVDELQDTDPVQMEIIELLVGKGLTAGKLFAVGDANQSIYRFRGAEVALFTGLRDKMDDAGRQSLTVNYRSQPAILDFVNNLLSHDVPGYEPLQPHLPQVNPQPCVEMMWTPAESDAQTNRKAEAKQIAGRIARMISTQEKIVTERVKDHPPRLRPARLGDIVLLFRAMSNVGIYESALSAAKLDYYVVGGRAFYAQQEIYDVLNLVKALGNPLDSLSLAGVLRSPFGGISDDGLHQLARHEHGLWSALNDGAVRKRLPSDDRAPADRIAKWLTSWRELKDRLPIAQLLNRVASDSGYDAALQYENLGDRKLANLWKLIDQARVFDAAGGFTLDDFERKLEELVAAQPREEQAATQPAESNVVRIMSIHQAKGLEFPVVFLPDFAGKTRTGVDPLVVCDAAFGCLAAPPNEEPEPFPKFARKLYRERESHFEKAEELRVLYVACTRAADYLVISGSLDADAKAANHQMALLSRRFHLDTGKCREDVVS